MEYAAGTSISEALAQIMDVEFQMLVHDPQASLSKSRMALRRANAGFGADPAAVTVTYKVRG
jgi:hypothetical protein